MGEAFGTPQRIVAAVVKSNARRKRNLIHRVRRACGGSLTGKRVAVLGLAFKADTDDVRESPALDLLPALAREAAEVRAHDPCAIEMAKAALDGAPLAYCRDLWACLEDADAVVVLTQWRDYLALDWARVAEAMRGKVVVDFRNVIDPLPVTACGLDYHCIGARPAPALDPSQQVVAAAE
jgi:UDPglucose 6-dehydrogenase